MYLTEIEKFRKEGSTDEWYISKLIESCLSELDSELAFTEIDSVIIQALKESEWDIFINHCQYILSLARLANTSEMPEQFKKNVSAFNAKVSELKLSKHNEICELYSWYRIKN